MDPERTHAKLVENAKKWFDSSEKSETKAEAGYGGMRSVGYYLQTCREEFEVRMKCDEKKVPGPSSRNERFDRALIEAYEMYSRAF